MGPRRRQRRLRRLRRQRRQRRQRGRLAGNAQLPGLHDRTLSPAPHQFLPAHFRSVHLQFRRRRRCRRRCRRRRRRRRLASHSIGQSGGLQSTHDQSARRILHVRPSPPPPPPPPPPLRIARGNPNTNTN